MVRVIDASGCVLGRLCSVTAKVLLTTEDEVAIVNCEKAIVTGRKAEVYTHFKAKRDTGTSRKGPFYPRVPHRIVKRVVRGMLPYQQEKGRHAHRKLKCYIGVPPELAGEKAEVLGGAKPRSGAVHLELGAISKRLGAKFEVVR